MGVSDKHTQELKELMEKKSGKAVSWDEAAEAARNLAGLADVLFDCWVTDQKRKKKLEEFPKGFHLEGAYSCAVCGGSARDEESWYDKWGIKCMVCQEAVRRKEIPGSVAKFKDSWYSRWELERSFNLDHHALKRWVKAGILKPRSVTNNGRTHVQIFLIKDNKDTLPPKKLVESQMVRIEKDDGTWFRSEPWYKFVDPHEHLKGYKIMDYLKVTHGEKTES